MTVREGSYGVSPHPADGLLRSRADSTPWKGTAVAQEGSGPRVDPVRDRRGSRHRRHRLRRRSRSHRAGGVHAL